MNKVTIGTILRNRIAEQKMKQEEFAERADISISSLKKYMNGERAYTYDKLITFAELLDCSCEYLLGESLSPKRDRRDVKEQTRLSDRALGIICSFAKNYDNDNASKQVIDVINTIIESDELFALLLFYISATKEQMKDYQIEYENKQKEIMINEYGKYYSKLPVKMDFDTEYALALRWKLVDVRENYQRHLKNKTQFK